MQTFVKNTVLAKVKLNTNEFFINIPCVGEVLNPYTKWGVNSFWNSKTISISIIQGDVTYHTITSNRYKPMNDIICMNSFMCNMNNGIIPLSRINLCNTSKIKVISSCFFTSLMYQTFDSVVCNGPQHTTIIMISHESNEREKCFYTDW